MNAMDQLKDIICRELDEIAEKGEMSAGDLDAVYKLVVTKEKILRIEELEEELGYSQDGGWRAEGTYSRGGRYDRRMSYDDRGGSYDGNSYGGNGNSYGRHYVRGHYSRGRGRYSMSEGKDMMAEQLRGMMDDQDLSQADRQALQKAMEQLQK